MIIEEHESGLRSPSAPHLLTSIDIAMLCITLDYFSAESLTRAFKSKITLSLSADYQTLNYRPPAYLAHGTVLYFASSGNLY